MEFLLFSRAKGKFAHTDKIQEFLGSWHMVNVKFGLKSNTSPEKQSEGSLAG